MIKVIELKDSNNCYFEKICDWNSNWWGKNYDKRLVRDFMIHCVGNEYLPKTFIAIKDNVIVGMYQIALYDDIDVRLNYYPWMINVYVDEPFRGQKIVEILINDMKKRCKELGIKKIYLHSEHIGLYEKYGWVFIEEVETFNHEKKRIYFLDMNL